MFADGMVAAGGSWGAGAIGGCLGMKKVTLSSSLTGSAAPARLAPRSAAITMGE